MKWNIQTNAANGKRYCFIPRALPTHRGTIPIGTFAEVRQEREDGIGHTLIDIELIDGTQIEGIDITPDKPGKLGYGPRSGSQLKEKRIEESTVDFGLGEISASGTPRSPSDRGPF